jgi:hypothetical protein
MVCDAFYTTFTADADRSDGGRHMQPRSEEFHAHAAECEGLAKRYGSLIKEQYEQLARQWLFLAEQAEAETFNRRTLVVRDPVLLCAPPRS